MTKQEKDQHGWRLRMLFLHGVMLAAPVLLLIAHSRFGFNVPAICVINRAFGVDCPACGITRSVLALFSGRVAEAFHIHPAGPVVVGIVGGMVSYLFYVIVGRRRGFEWRKEVRMYGMIELFLIGVLLLGWAGKLISH